LIVISELALLELRLPVLRLLYQIPPLRHAQIEAHLEEHTRPGISYLHFHGAGTSISASSPHYAPSIELLNRVILPFFHIPTVTPGSSVVQFVGCWSFPVSFILSHDHFTSPLRLFLERRVVESLQINPRENRIHSLTRVAVRSRIYYSSPFRRCKILKKYKTAHWQYHTLYSGIHPGPMNPAT